ncbi:MAG: hypothetical protein Q9195_000473 [Heterodermia aff. obscurata]
MLPLEIRLEIYRYLVGRYAKRPHNMLSQEYNKIRDTVMEGPDHSYGFHPRILGVNQQIRREAADLFQRENTLVSLTYNMIGPPVEYYPWTSHATLFEHGVHVLVRDSDDDEVPVTARVFREQGFPVPARDFDGHESPVLPQYSKASACPAMGMSIELAVTRGKVRGDNDEVRDLLRLPNMVQAFTLDDLPAACVTIQRNIDEAVKWSQKVYIRIVVSSGIDRMEGLSDDLCPVPGSKLRRCLEPLRQLRDVCQVDLLVDGCPAYADNLANTMCGWRRTAKEIMDLAVTHFDRGDDHFHRKSPKSAIDEYKAALHTIRSGSFDEKEFGREMIGGRFDGFSAVRARDDAVVQLHARIAAAFLQLGEHRLARIYVARIYTPLASFDDRINRQKFPLKITTGDVQVDNPKVYARLLVVAAQISLVHGKWAEAKTELEEAKELDPDDLDIHRRWEEVEERLLRRAWKRRERGRHFQRGLREMIEVAHRRRVKGDDAARKGNFPLARQLYEAAYDKLRHRPVCEYRSLADSRARDDDLEHKVRHEWREEDARIVSELIMVVLELQDYEAVYRWAVLSIYNGYYFEAEDIGHDWTIDQYYEDYFEENRILNRRPLINPNNEAAYIAHYGKAVALQKQGKITAAIREFMLALRDRACHASYYQLKLLEQRWLDMTEEELEMQERYVEEEKETQERGIGYAEEGKTEEREVDDDQDREDS